jgi:hypothetical protein
MPVDVDANFRANGAVDVGLTALFETLKEVTNAPWWHVATASPLYVTLSERITR